MKWLWWRSASFMTRLISGLKSHCFRFLDVCDDAPGRSYGRWVLVGISGDIYSGQRRRLLSTRQSWGTGCEEGPWLWSGWNGFRRLYFFALGVMVIKKSWKKLTFWNSKNSYYFYVWKLLSSVRVYEYGQWWWWPRWRCCSMAMVKMVVYGQRRWRSWWCVCVSCLWRPLCFGCPSY